MPRWNGGVIGAANNPTSSSAKGIWSLSEATKAIRAGLWPPSNAGADPYFENVTLLLPGDGTNGAQNNTFLDSSTNNFTITRNGNTTQGTFSPFSKVDGRWGNYLDGTGDYLSISDNAAFNLSSGSWTVECWINMNGGSGYRALVSKRNAPSSAEWEIGVSDTGYLYFYNGTVYASTTTVPSNQWIHVAATYDGSNLRLFQDGVVVKTQASITAGSGSAGVYIGAIYTGGQPFPGFISNVRVLKGTAQYTGAFTPSTAPLTAITNTSLLTCQSNRFIDNSTNAFAITRNGDVAVTTFSPFPSLTAYAAGTNGGSGYFDGTGDYLSIADNAAFEFGSGDFCVEFFAYIIAQDSSGVVFVSQWNSPNRGWIFGYAGSGGTLNFDYSTTGSNSTSVNAAVTLPINQWAHFAACRTGNTLSTYLNGSRVATASVTGVTIYAPSQALEIGRNTEATTAWEMNGYISGLRIVKGSSVYDATQSTLTVPTAPLTAITNTGVLLNFTNGGIIDTSMSNDLETVGGAQISTTQSKWGGASMYFDGNGDYLYEPSTQNLTFGTGDFTVEFWLYLNTIAADQGVIDMRPASTQGDYPALFFLDSGDTLVWVAGGINRITSSALSASTWYHVAISRSGTSTKMFLNGTQTGSTYTDSTNYLCSRVVIGASSYTLGSAGLNAYIDDLRVTKGVARYTANFTAPSGPFIGFGD